MKVILKDEVLKLRKEGKTYKEIKAKLKCTLSVISYHCRRENLDNPNLKRRPTEDEIHKLNKLYSQGKTCKEAGKEVGISKTTAIKYITIPKRKRVKKLTASQSVISWRKRRKKELVESMGGECQICGYKRCIDALHFHHKDPDQKDFTISGKSWSIERLKEEADKCILVCANCHAEIHSK